MIDFNSIEVPKDNEEILDNEIFYLNTIDPELAECLANLLPINPTTIENIVNHQSRDPILRRAPLDNPDQYQHQEIQRMDVVCRTEGNQWKIALPQSLVRDVLTWHHLILGHCGMDGLYQTVSSKYHSPILRELCKETVENCPYECQQFKQQQKQYGQLPPQIAQVTLWTDVAVDLIGLWTIKLNNQKIYTFSTLTCIDLVTNFTEAIQIRNKSSRHVAEQFYTCWLSQYLTPVNCIYDNGGKFIRAKFKDILNRAGINKR